MQNLSARSTPLQPHGWPESRFFFNLYKITQFLLDVFHLFLQPSRYPRSCCGARELVLLEKPDRMCAPARSWFQYLWQYSALKRLPVRS